MTREEVYDEKIAPLMTQIIEACNEHHIPMIADFDLSDEDQDGLRCTSSILPDEWEPPKEMIEAYHILKPKPLQFYSFITRTNPNPQG
jgi:hypothetical protein